jgi:hypothetical protein
MPNTKRSDAAITAFAHKTVTELGGDKAKLSAEVTKLRAANAELRSVVRGYIISHGATTATNGGPQYAACKCIRCEPARAALAKHGRAK